jgi:hypothetical protein
MELHLPEPEVGKEVGVDTSLNKVCGFGCNMALLCSLMWFFSPCQRGEDEG